MQGALVVKALEMAMEIETTTNFQQQLQGPDVSAETSERISTGKTIATRRADAIAEVAETCLNAEPSVQPKGVRQ